MAVKRGHSASGGPLTLLRLFGFFFGEVLALCAKKPIDLSIQSTPLGIVLRVFATCKSLQIRAEARLPTVELDFSIWTSRVIFLLTSGQRARRQRGVLGAVVGTAFVFERPCLRSTVRDCAV